MAFRSSNHNATSANPVVVTAPAGVTSGDIIVLAATADDDGAATFTWPAGFTEISGSPIHVTDDGQSFGVAIKLAGSEPGSYSITASNGNVTAAVAAFSGRDSSTTVHRVSMVLTSGLNSPPQAATSAAFGSATSVDHCDMVYIATIDNGTNGATSWEPPTGFTEQVDDTNSLKNCLTLATQDDQASGQTGVIAGTYNGTPTGRALIAALAIAAGAGGGSFSLDDDDQWQGQIVQGLQSSVALW